jgi:BMFP domain-containing protein YqiC
LIDALKRTISQLEAKKNPAEAAKAAKKKAVNNI